MKRSQEEMTKSRKLPLLFSTQNQVPQIIFGVGRVIDHIKALSVVIRTLKPFEQFSQCLEKPDLKFLVQFRANKI